MITVAQIKAARGLLDWTQDDLANAAGISRPALNNLERRLTQPHRDTTRRIQQAFERSGVEFISGGARLKQDVLDVRIFEGKDALFELYDDVIATYMGTGGLTLVSGVDETRFIEIGNKKFFEYLEKFKKLGITDRLLIKEGDTNLVMPKQLYRWVPEDIFNQVPYIVYGNKYAIILWRPPTKIVLVESAQIAESFRRQFNAHWTRGRVPVIKEK